VGLAGAVAGPAHWQWPARPTPAKINTGRRHRSGLPRHFRRTKGTCVDLKLAASTGGGVLRRVRLARRPAGACAATRRRVRGDPQARPQARPQAASAGWSRKPVTVHT